MIRAQVIRVVPLLAALLLASCKHTDPATVVVVELDSDFGSELTRVDVVIRDDVDHADGGHHQFALGKQLSFPFSFSVLPHAGKLDQRFVIVATGRNADGEPLVETKASAGFTRGQTLGLTLLLMRRCRGVSCEAGQTCAIDGEHAGGCDDIPSAELKPLEPGGQPKPSADRDAGAMPHDGGSTRDAGEHDARVPAGGSGAPHDDASMPVDGGLGGSGGTGGSSSPEPDAAIDSGTPEPDAGDAGHDSGTPPAEVCDDNLDNDEDGDTDCADSDCDGQACDDGSSCTPQDSCVQGQCKGTIDPNVHSWKKLAGWPGTNSGVSLQKVDGAVMLEYRSCSPCGHHLLKLDASGNTVAPEVVIQNDSWNLVTTSNAPGDRFLSASMGFNQQIEVRGPDFATVAAALPLGKPTNNWMGVSGANAAYNRTAQEFGVVHVAYNADYSVMGMYLTRVARDGSIIEYDKSMLPTTTNGYGPVAAGWDGTRYVALFDFTSEIFYSDGTAAKATPVGTGTAYGSAQFAHDRFVVFEQTGDQMTRKVNAHTFDSSANVLRSRQLPIVWPDDNEWSLSSIDNGYVFFWKHATHDLAGSSSLRVLVTDTNLDIVGQLAEFTDVPYPKLTGATLYLYGSTVLQTDAKTLVYGAHAWGEAGSADDGSIQLLTLSCLPLP